MMIGPIEAGHLPELGALYQELTGEPSNPERMEEVYVRVNRDPAYHLIGACTDTGVLCGTAMGIVCLDLVKNCRPFLVIENVVVAEAFRGFGIGKALMAELERIAVGLGCSYAILVSGAQRTEAHRFYDALGYGPDRAKGFKKDLKHCSGESL